MAYRLPSLNALRAFEAAARHLSFKNAAHELSVTPAAISHQIKLLEDFLEVSLFRRLTRALELSPEGEALLPKVREGMMCFSVGIERLRQRVALERLIVVAPPSFASRWLVPRLRGFSDAHPAIELHVRSSAYAIDGEDGQGTRAFDEIDPSDDDAHVAICFGSGNYPGLSTQHILSSGYIAVCSPCLLEGKHALRQPADVRFHALIHDDTVANESVRPSWTDWLQQAGVGELDAVKGPHFCDSGLALVAAADGQGIVLASKPLVVADIAAGTLVSPFKISLKSDFAYYLVTPEAIAGRPAVVAFSEWLTKEAQATEAFHRSIY